MTIKNILRLLACIALPVAVGGFSGFLTVANISGWYTTLAKPSFNPPNYLFGPVWTLLYVLMGVSFYLVLNQPKSKERSLGFAIYGIQLFLNFWWSIIFFSLKRVDFAMVEIVVLWITILGMIIVFFKVKKQAAYLQIPYLLWVSFASALNLGILLLN